MKRKKQAKKLNLSRDTLSVLDPKSLVGLAAGAKGCTEESALICSVQHTCVSCQDTGNCA